MATLILIIMIIAILLILTIATWFAVNRVDEKPINVFYVHNGKLISKEEASMYELDYIEYYNGTIIKYYVKMKGIN